MNVYACIAAVSAEVAKVGIGKDRKNEQQGYKFRGIDDVYNVVAPIIAKHGLVILPRVLSRSVTERQTKSGSMQFFVVVDAEFDFVAASDGSKHTVKMFGEAQDTGDKATNKAQSAAYKYAAFQTFCIPTEGDNDADATTPELTAATAALRQQLAEAGIPPAAPPAADNGPTSPPVPPGGFEAWIVALEATADDGTEPLKAAWKASKPAYRKYVTTHMADTWEALKAIADRKSVSA